MIPRHLEEQVEICVRVMREHGVQQDGIDRFLETVSKTAQKSRPLYAKDLSGHCYVYYLVNPETDTPFYVGITKYHPSLRFRDHSHDRLSAAWAEINRLFSEGWEQDDILRIYKKCAHRNEALEIEHHLISTTPGLVNRDRKRRRYWGPQ